MLVFTKQINEPKITAMPGTPVPLKYAKNNFALAQIREKYGDDVFKDDGYRNANEFITKAGTDISRLQAKCDEQAAVNKALTAENDRLKKQLKERSS